MASLLTYQIVANDTTNTDNFIPFCDTGTGETILKTSAFIKYNPSTKVVTTDKIAITSGTTTTATPLTSNTTIATTKYTDDAVTAGLSTIPGDKIGIRQGACIMSSGITTTQKIFAENGGVPASTGVNSVSSNACMIYLDPADFPSYNGKTAHIVMRAMIATNDFAPVSNYDFGLFPVTTSGTATQFMYTTGSVLNSVFTITAPPANTVTVATSSPMSLPGSAGVYVLGIKASAVSVSLCCATLSVSIIYS